MRPFYVTTPIYYVNDVPHLGTAYTTVAADALRRVHAVFGEDSRMLTGTDEHGLKIERVAAERGQAPQAFVDEMSQRFSEAWPKLDVVASDFIRTTEPRHEEFVKALWKKAEDNGDLYLGEYEDWYCVGCESFKTEKELIQPGNLCPDHLKPVERVKEETYFFRLSKYEKPLLDLYARNPDFIQPESRKNEVISFVEGGLKDLSVSRTSFSWGVPVPGNARHVMYVWFDALVNYRSALGHGELTRFWPPRGEAVHLMGKDIVRFHAVYWPAFLLGAGYKLDELPSKIFAHGFLTVEGRKMGKALRNAVDPLRIAEELGVDALRYYLLRAISFGLDGDFSHGGLIGRYNADLAKNIGNLFSRTLGLSKKLAGNVTTTVGERTEHEERLFQACEEQAAAARAAWLAMAPHRALEATCALGDAANLYVDRTAPWAAAKANDTARVGTILASLTEALRFLSVMLWPAMPKKSDEMRALLGLAPVVPALGVDQWPVKVSPRPAGEALGASSTLFPTIDDEREAALLLKLVPAEAKDAPPVEPAKSAEASAPVTAAAPTEAAPVIGYDQFTAVDLRVGLVTTCERVPKKDKLLKLAVDLGEPAPRTIVAGLALTFKPEDLVGRRVVVVANLAPREFGKGLVSHGMILATGPSEALVLPSVDAAAAPGARLK